MATKDKSVFFTDAGEEISVRTIAQHTPTAITMLEPLYATDAESMNGIVGELRLKNGKLLRGTLRRQGNAFALYPEQPQQEVLEKTEPKSPVEAPPPRAAKVKEPMQETGTSQTGTTEAPRTVARVPPGERSQVKTDTTSPVAPQPARRAKPKEKAPEAPPALSVPPRVVKPQDRVPSIAAPPRSRPEPNEKTPEIAPSHTEAMEALKTIAQFLGADRSAVSEKTEKTPVFTSQSPPSQGEAIEAERTVAQFLRGDDSVDLELAKQAHAIVSDFIAEVERQMKRDA